MPDLTPKSADPPKNVESSSSRGLGDLTIDFFGSLIPGIAFWFGMFPSLLIPIFHTFVRLTPKEESRFPLLDGIFPASVDVILLIVIPLLAAFLVSAYVAGHLFFRQDPKFVDVASAKRIPRGEFDDMMIRPENFDKKDLELQSKVKKAQTHIYLDNKTKIVDIQFPYKFLKEYLLHRGLSYLSDYVPWEGRNITNRRTKHFANSLKIRIHLISESAYRIVSRNEAHIRLSSSMWYVAKTLSIASYFGIIIYMSMFLWLYIESMSVSLLEYSKIAIPMLSLFAALFTKFAIEKSFHYQRAREILFILEVAYWLKVSGESPKIFDSIVDY